MWIFFLLPSNWHKDNFLQTLTWHGLSFSMFTVWHGLFSLVLMFPGLRSEAPLPSTVQGKCRYTFFKWRTRKFNFRSYVLNFRFQCLLFGTDFFLWYSCFLGWEVKIHPHPQYRVSVYTLFLKWRTRKFNFRSYVLSLVKINISFCLSKVGSMGPIYRPYDLASTISSADLSALCATIVESSGPI